MHDLAGTSYGSTDPLGFPVLQHIESGTIFGESALDPAELYRIILFSGTTIGRTDVRQASPSLSGSSTGNTTLTAQLVRVCCIRGSSYGKTNLVLSLPMPIVGGTTLSGYLEHTEVLPACTPCDLKAFRYGQFLQRGDLTISIVGPCGVCINPYRVSYTLYQIFDNSCFIPVDPMVREPVKGGDIGEYYAVGYAGEGGQPGKWAIRWEYQIFFDGAVNTKVEFFLVQDAISAGIPDPDRICQKGWF